MGNKRWVESGDITLWINNHLPFSPFFAFGVWRIVWGNPDRLIINYAIHPNNDLIKKLSSMGVFSLQMYYRECGNPDNLKGQIPLYSFNDCKINRKWIPSPLSLNREDKIVQGFVELTCKIIEGDNG